MLEVRYLTAPVGELDLNALNLKESDVEGFIKAVELSTAFSSASVEKQTAYVYWRAYGLAYQRLAAKPQTKKINVYSHTYGPQSLAYLKAERDRWGQAIADLVPELQDPFSTLTRPKSDVYEKKAGF